MINFLFTKTPLMFFVQSFWRDEAFTYLLSKEGFWQIFSLTAKDFNPPLYYLLINLWLRIFGGTEISLRLFSLICFWGIIYLAFLFLNKIFKFSVKKSFFYLIFFISNPLLVYYAFEARMYTLLALLAGLSFYFFYQKKWTPYIISTTLGLYTHYFMVFVIMSHFLLTWLAKEKDHLKMIKRIAISCLLFLPWLVYLLLNRPFANPAFWIEKPKLLGALHFFAINYTGFGDMIPSHEIDWIKKILFFLNLVLFTLTLIGIAKFPKFKKTAKQQFILFFVWGIVIPVFVGLISFVKPIYLSRYLIFATFGFILFLVFVLDSLHSRAFSIMFSIIILICAFLYNNFQIKYQTKTDFRKIIREIKTLSKKNDLLYVVNELDYFPAEYYYGVGKVYIYEKNYQDIPDYVGKVLIPQNKVVSRLPTYPQKAFVLNLDGSYDIKAMY